MNTLTSRWSNVLRSLHVLLLALLGLAFYAAVVLLIAGLCFLVFSSSVHAQEPPGTWTTVGSMAVPRTAHTATLLDDGEVLAVGGYTQDQTVPTDRTELYDPSTRSWRPGAPLLRGLHTATLLANGRVLVAAGFGENGSITAAATLYDPADGAWHPTGSLNYARISASAVRLADGRVLIAGGQTVHGTTSAFVLTSELYDPQSGTWTPTGAMQQWRTFPALTLLGNGKVLATGGNSLGDSIAELFDPHTQTWSSAGLQPAYGSAALLPSGKVMVTTGYAGSAIYDPQANAWAPGPALADTPSDCSITVLANGYVLGAGGVVEVTSPGQTDTNHYFGHAELYDGTRWLPAASMSVPRCGHTATLLANGDVLVAGGTGEPSTPTGDAVIGTAEVFTLPPVSIDGSFTGSWYDPDQSGQGLMLEILPGGSVLALWFSFSPTGQQAWFGGVGSYSGNSATIGNVSLPTGGKWVSSFDGSTVAQNPWGTLSLTFTDHDHGKVDFASALGYGSGSMKLTRLTRVATAASATASPIGPPVAVVADAHGNVYFSSAPDRIFKMDARGGLTGIAGTGTPGYSGDGGPATRAQLNFPQSYPELVADPIDYSPLIGGLAIDGSGRLYIADAYNNRVRRIDSAGIITTIAGTGAPGYSSGSMPATSAAITWPQGVATDAAGNFYFSTAYATLRKVTPDGTISTIAGDNCGPGYLGPGFCVPEGIAIDAAGNLFVTDAYCRVREVRASDGAIFTVAGADSVSNNGTAFTCGYSGDGGPATKAAASFPYGVAVDASGNLFFTDTYNNCVRKVNAAGVIDTFAGVCATAGAFSGDGGPAVGAHLNQPFGVAVDSVGNVYIADMQNNRVRKVSSDGIITTVAGNGAPITAPAAAAIGPAFTGNWYNPAQSGHGLMLEVLPDNQLLALWFAFSPTGEQSWFGGVGSYSGNVATISGVALPTGGKWLPNFDPDALTRNAWGTLTFTFSDCNHGKVDYRSTYDGYGSGSMELTRLTLPQGLACP